MKDTTLCVNELLQVLSAGVVIRKNQSSETLKSVIQKLNPDSANLDIELKRLLTHMRRIGLIHKEKLSDSNIYLMLSAKGKKRLTSIKLNAISIPRPNKWDGRWRIVSFDIPRGMRSKRYELLRELHRLGFKKLLQSMWVFPFPCRKEVYELASSLGLQENVIHIEAKLDKKNDEYLKTQFVQLIK